MQISLSLKVIAIIALALTGPVLALPDPPPPPLSPTAYAALTPNPERTARTPGTTWYWQSAVIVDGASVSLEKAAVRCSPKYLSWSLVDGGWLKYKGVLTQGPAGLVAHLKLELCYDCKRNGISVPSELNLPVEFHPATVLIDGHAHTRGTQNLWTACPVE